MSTTGKWECPDCGKIISQTSKRYHLANSCGKTALKCEICGACFNTRSAKSRHKKLCKAANVVNDHSTNYDHSTHNDHRNITNITNNNTINNTININFFGREELGYITDNAQTDERYGKMLKNQVGTIRFVHFNSDHPENHNIRKKCKNDTLMEYRLANRPDEWTTDSYHTILKQVQKNLEDNLGTRFLNRLTLFQLQQQIYLLTKTGPVPSEVILKQYEPEEMEPKRAAMAAILQERDIYGCMVFDKKNPKTSLNIKKTLHKITAMYGFHPLADIQIVKLFSTDRRIPVLTPITEPAPVFEPEAPDFPMSDEEKMEQKARTEEEYADKFQIPKDMRTTTTFFDPDKGRQVWVFKKDIQC